MDFMYKTGTIFRVVKFDPISEIRLELARDRLFRRGGQAYCHGPKLSRASS